MADKKEEPYQPGGWVMLSIDKIAYMILGQGIDHTSLDRWEWVKYREKYYKICGNSKKGPTKEEKSKLWY